MGEMSPGDQMAAGLESANATGNAGVAEPASAPAPQQTPSAPTPSGNNAGGGHPAWNEYLKDIPEGFHGVVKPAFERWDKEVENRLREVHSQYDPYKSFVEAKVDPQQLNEAWSFLNFVAENPQKVWEALGQHYGFGGQGQPEETDEVDEIDLGDDQQRFDLEKDPRFQQLQQQQQAIVAGMQQAQQQRLMMDAEAQLDQQIKTTEETLRGAQIEPDARAMRFITMSAMAYNEQDGGGNEDANFQKATQDYVDLMMGARSAPRAGASAPPVMPTNGGTPSNRVDTASMSDEDRRRYMADMLTAAKRST